MRDFDNIDSQTAIRDGPGDGSETGERLRPPVQAGTSPEVGADELVRLAAAAALCTADAVHDRTGRNPAAEASSGEVLQVLTRMVSALGFLKAARQGGANGRGGTQTEDRR